MTKDNMPVNDNEPVFDGCMKKMGSCVLVFLFSILVLIGGCYAYLKIDEYRHRDDIAARKYDEMEQDVVNRILRDDSVTKMQKLIELGFDADKEIGPGGTTLIWRAVKEQKYGVLEYLIEIGADVNQVNKAGQSLLFEAAEHGWLEGAELLIENGAPLDTPSDSGLTPLAISMMNNFTYMTEFLNKKGAKMYHSKEDKWETIHWAIFINDVGMARNLIETGDIVGCRDCFWCDIEDYEGCDTCKDCRSGGPITDEDDLPVNVFCPTTLASGRIFFMKYCITPWAVPLHLAALYNRVEIAEILLQNGSDIEAKATKGVTPLFVAAVRGNKEMVSFLIDHGADVNAVNNDGETIIEYAKPDMIENEYFTHRYLEVKELIERKRKESGLK